PTMNQQQVTRGRVVILLVTGLFLVAAMTAFWLWAGETSARAGSPPPSQPQFEGIAVSERFPVPGLNDRPSTRAAAAANGWEILFSETVEEGFDKDVWLTLDRNGAQRGEYKRRTREFENTLGGGTLSAWAIGGGQDGANLEVENDGYPAGV